MRIPESLFLGDVTFERRSTGGSKGMRWTLQIEKAASVPAKAGQAGGTTLWRASEARGRSPDQNPLKSFNQEMLGCVFKKVPPAATCLGRTSGQLEALWQAGGGPESWRSESDMRGKGVAERCLGVNIVGPGQGQSCRAGSCPFF